MFESRDGSKIEGEVLLTPFCFVKFPFVLVLHHIYNDSRERSTSGSLRKDLLSSKR